MMPRAERCMLLVGAIKIDLHGALVDLIAESVERRRRNDHVSRS